MPTTLASGDICEVRMFYKGETGQEAINVLHYVVGAVTGSPTDQTMADNIMTSTFTSILNALPINVTLDGVEVSIINRLPLPLTVRSILHAGPGINPATFSLNPQVTGLISWGTAFAGRAFRGRLYLPWVPNTALNTSGFPNAGYISLVASVAGAFFTFTSVGSGPSTAAVFQCIYHRSTRLADAVVSWIASNKFATQRRRGNFGKNRTPPI